MFLTEIDLKVASLVLVPNLAIRWCKLYDELTNGHWSAYQAYLAILVMFLFLLFGFCSFPPSLLRGKRVNVNILSLLYPLVYLTPSQVSRSATVTMGVANNCIALCQNNSICPLNKEYWVCSTKTCTVSYCYGIIAFVLVMILTILHCAYQHLSNFKFPQGGGGSLVRQVNKTALVCRFFSGRHVMKLC